MRNIFPGCCASANVPGARRKSVTIQRSLLIMAFTFQRNGYAMRNKLMRITTYGCRTAKNVANLLQGRRRFDAPQYRKTVNSSRELARLKRFDRLFIVYSSQQPGETTSAESLVSSTWFVPMRDSTMEATLSSLSAANAFATATSPDRLCRFSATTIARRRSAFV